MLSYIVHYKNKYPGGQVQASENAIDVYDVQNNHAVALRKNGAGQWVDESEKFGCIDKHCLAPIPKDARVHKVQNGVVGFDEDSAERISKRSDLIREDRKILSELEYKAEKK